MYNGLKVLDVHAHVTAPWGAYGSLAMMLGTNTANRGPLLVAGKGLPANYGINDDDFRAAAERHVNYINARNIDVQVIGPRPLLHLAWMEDHLLEGWCREVNEMIFQQCTYHPDRFIGACQLPLVSTYPSTANVLPELRRCVDDYGFGAAYVTPDPSGRRDAPGMHEDYWYPLYEECEGRDLPIIVHATNSLDRRLRILPGNYQMAFYTEQFFATQLLGHGDVFDRYPKLRFIICHCGGALDRFVKGDPHLPSRDTTPNLFFDTNAPDIDFLTAAIRQKGVDQMCFGVEAPGSGSHPRENGVPGDDMVPVIAAFDWLSEDDKAKIFHHNPARVVPKLATV